MIDFKNILDRQNLVFFNGKLDYKIDDYRIHISYEYSTFDTFFIDKKKGTFKLFTSMRVDDEKEGIDISDPMIFEHIVHQCFIKLKERLVEDYKKGYVKTLPLEYNIESKSINITSEDFTTIFNDIAEDVGNSETVENVVVIKDGDKIKITYDIDCGGYGLHRNNKMIINKFGKVKNDITELLEGGNVDYRLKRKIEKKFK